MAIWRNASEAWMGADPDDDGVDRDYIVEEVENAFEDALLISLMWNLPPDISDKANDILSDLLMGNVEGLAPEILERLRKADDLIQEGPNDEEAFYLRNPVLDEDIPVINQWIQAQEVLKGVPQGTLTVENVKDFIALPQRAVEFLVDNWKAPEPDYGY